MFKNDRFIHFEKGLHVSDELKYVLKHTWVSSCYKQDVFFLSLPVQSLCDTQLTAGWQSERSFIVPATEHVAQLSVGALVVISGNNLEIRLLNYLN